jgi:hypothetical protein
MIVEYVIVFDVACYNTLTVKIIRIAESLVFQQRCKNKFSFPYQLDDFYHIGLRVTWWLSFKNQKLLTLRVHMRSVLLILVFFCFGCLRSVSCVVLFWLSSFCFLCCFVLVVFVLFLVLFLKQKRSIATC